MLCFLSGQEASNGGGGGGGGQIFHFLPVLFSKQHFDQGWANLDQAPKDLDKTIFRDLSPTPLPWVLEVLSTQAHFFGAALETIAEKSR